MEPPCKAEVLGFVTQLFLGGSLTLAHTVSGLGRLPVLGRCWKPGLGV